MINMKKTIGILVTYNPDIPALKENVLSIVSQIDTLVIFDNNSYNIFDIESMCIDYNVKIYKSPINVGLGKAYNEVLKVEHEFYEYFITFDQDTFIPTNSIKILIEILNTNDHIGAVGPAFSRYFNFINRGKLHYKKVIIQSAALFRMLLFDEIGGFNESYFIDSVDFEYCLRINEINYKVALYDGVIIQHQLGEEKKFGKYTYSTHNSFRLFHIARNHKQLSKDYFRKYPSLILKKNVFFLLEIMKIVFLERDLSKLNSIIKGLKSSKLHG